MSAVWWRSYGAVGGFVLLTAVTCVLLARYVGLEHTFYHWDHALYPGWAEALWRTVQTDGVWAAARVLRESLNDDFSKLFTLPAVTAFALTGSVARPVYVMANFLAYGVGLALLLGGLLRQLLGGGFWGNAVAALAALLACSFVWVSVVEGYPDLGGAALLAAALLVVLRDWPRVMLWRWLVAGLLLAVAIVFRRHFIYPAAVLLLVFGCGQLFFCWRNRVVSGWWRFLPLVGVGLAGVTAAAGLYLLAPLFVMRLVTMQYPALYASYAEESAGLLELDLLRVGALNFLLALAGYALAWRRWPAQRARLAVLLGLLAVWGGLWFGWVRFGGQHYLSQILPIILPIGWVFLVAGCWRRRWLAWAVMGLLAVQAVSGFWVAESGQGKQWFNGVFAAARPPVVRADYAVISGLVRDLLAQSKPEDRIAVVASSPLFNQDILWAALQAQPDAATAHLPLVMMPDVDRRDPLPLDAMSQATILVVVTPPQYHLRPEGQLVVGGVLAMLQEDKEFAAAWQRETRTYPLEQGAVATVWRLRQPWTPAERAAMLGRLRQRVQPSGSLPQDWVVQRADFTVRSLTDGQNRSAVMGEIGTMAHMLPLQLFFSVPVVAGGYRLVGRQQNVSAGCTLPMALRLLRGDGVVLTQIPVTVDATGRFDQSLAMGQDFYLQLELLAQAADKPLCHFEVGDLRVEHAP